MAYPLTLGLIKDDGIIPILDFRGICLKSTVMSSHCTLVYTPALRRFGHQFRDKQTNFSALVGQSKDLRVNLAFPSLKDDLKLH